MTHGRRYRSKSENHSSVCASASFPLGNVMRGPVLRVVLGLRLPRPRGHLCPLLIWLCRHLGGRGFVVTSGVAVIPVVSKCSYLGGWSCSFFHVGTSFWFFFFSFQKGGKSNNARGLPEAAPVPAGENGLCVHWPGGLLSFFRRPGV